MTKLRDRTVPVFFVSYCELCKPQVSDFKLQASSFKPHAACSKSQAVGSRQQVASRKPQAPVNADSFPGFPAHAKRVQPPHFRPPRDRGISDSRGSGTAERSSPVGVDECDSPTAGSHINTKKVRSCRSDLEEAATYSPTGKPQYHRRE